jgi:nucleotide-binding universal stress UspA family protein
MSVKTILVHADPGTGCDRRVLRAVQIADLLGATVTGLGAEAFNPMLVTGEAGIDGAMMEVIRERIAADSPAAEKHFAALTAGRSGTRWVAAADYPDKMLSLHARGTDLIVVSRPARGESATFCASPADLIMEAGTPVLLAADGGAEFSGDRVGGGLEGRPGIPARRRRFAAVPDSRQGCRRRRRRGERPGRHAGLKDVARRLARHGVEAAIEVAPKGAASVAEALQAATERRGADLIVVGAYGHSRLRRAIACKQRVRRRSLC